MHMDTPYKIDGSGFNHAHLLPRLDVVHAKDAIVRTRHEVIGRFPRNELCTAHSTIYISFKQAKHDARVLHIYRQHGTNGTHLPVVQRPLMRATLPSGAAAATRA